MTDTRYHMDPAPVSWPPVLCQCHDFNTAEKRQACLEAWNIATGEMLNPSDKSNQWCPCLRWKGLSEGRKQISLSTPSSLVSLLMQLSNNSPSPSQCFQGALNASLQDILGNKKCSPQTVVLFSKQCSIVVGIFISTGGCSWIIPPYKKAPSARVPQSTDNGRMLDTQQGSEMQGGDAGVQPEMRMQILGRPSNRKCAMRIHKPGSEKEELAELTSFSWLGP